MRAPTISSEIGLSCFGDGMNCKIISVQVHIIIPVLCFFFFLGYNARSLGANANHVSPSGGN